jgi:hypothetical protein
MDSLHGNLRTTARTGRRIWTLVRSWRHPRHYRRENMSTEDPPLQFKFIEFNERRAMRGADAARVEVIDPTDPDGGPGWLWMNRRDIRNNIREHGDNPELQKAMKAYGAFA